MKSTRRMIAGLADAAFAALGTFLAGLVAVRELHTGSLAVYAVLFSATVLAMVVPRQLHYIPAQLAANVQDTELVPAIRAGARRALLATVITVVIVLASSLTLVGRAPWLTCVTMGLSAGAYAALSPLQDHVRSSLHLVGRHFSAAACSVLLAVTIGAGAMLALLGPGGALIDLVPFGSLFFGNLVSLVAGLLLLRGADRHVGYRPAAITVRAQYLFSEMSVQTAWLGCNYGILLLLGAPVLARLEAARIVSSPISILVTALMTFMIPAIIRNRKPTTDRPHGARNQLAATLSVLLIGGAVYFGALAIFGGPVSTIIDKPLDLGLWAARIGQAMIEGGALLVSVLLFALGRTRVVVASSAIAGGVGLVGTLALAPLIGPFALPVAQAIGMTSRLIGGLGWVRSETQLMQVERRVEFA